MTNISYRAENVVLRDRLKGPIQFSHSTPAPAVLTPYIPLPHLLKIKK